MPWTAFPSWVTSARRLGGFVYINYTVSLRTQHPLPLFPLPLPLAAHWPSWYPLTHTQFHTIRHLFCFSFWGCLSLRYLSCPFTLFRSLLKGYLFTQLSQQFFGTNPPRLPLTCLCDSLLFTRFYIAGVWCFYWYMQLLLNLSIIKFQGGRVLFSQLHP